MHTYMGMSYQVYVNNISGILFGENVVLCYLFRERHNTRHYNYQEICVWYQNTYW